MEKPKEIIEIEKFYNIILKPFPDEKGVENNKNHYFINDEEKITSINLTGNKISELTPLKNILSLENLYLGENRINYLSPLRNLSNLTRLKLFKNNISDITPLKNLSKLEEISLFENKIYDISPLKKLINLKYIYVSQNQISDIDQFKFIIPLKDIVVNLNGNPFVKNEEDREIVYYQNHYDFIVKKLSEHKEKPEQILEIEKLYNITLTEALNQDKIEQKQFFLNEDKQIIHLNLSQINISDLSPLANLKSLINLNLFNNQITDISLLKNLTNLIDLRLGSNKIVQIENLKNLNKLRVLSLEKNKVSDLSPLENLISLNKLYLYENKISNLSPLENLTKLELLSLNENNISDISYLKKLSLLKELDLSYNNVSDLSVLTNLKFLTKLYLNNNKIFNILDFEFILQLKQLFISAYENPLVDRYKIIIDKYENNYSSICEKIIQQNEKPNYVRELEEKYNILIRKIDSLNNIMRDDNRNTFFLDNNKHIIGLNLQGNKISSLSFLKNFTSLTYLNLSKNKISDLSYLKNLNQLKVLYLFNNDINDLSNIKDLNTLIILDLHSNSIIDLSPLKNLINLEQLYLTNNKISDISNLHYLSKLKVLFLSNNKISELLSFEFILDIKHFILTAGSNPFVNDYKIEIDDYFNCYDVIVNEILKRKDKQIKAFLPEKIILLGNHASGKSSLLHYLQNEKLEYDDNSTHILKIEQYPIKYNTLPKAIIYDFGGQDFYHGIYQVFLTSHATTLLLWNTKTNKNELKLDSKRRLNRNFKLNYWLGERNHKNYQGDIILIQTHADENDNHRFSHLNDNTDIVEEFFISLKKDYDNTHNLKKLDYVKSRIDNLIDDNRLLKNEKGTISKPYYEFLKYILNARATIKPVTKSSLRRKYKVKEDSRFEYDLNQLHLQGLLLIDDENVWLNPVAITKHIHSKILTPKNVGNGVIEKKLFESKGFNRDIIAMLLSKKIIFLHKNGLTSSNKKQEEYIIPNFLPLISESGIDYDLMTFGMDNPLFTLKFIDYIPFGLINEMVCYFGVLPDKKRFWRDQLIFTITEEENIENSLLNKKVQILIHLDFENLEIKVFSVFKNNASKDFTNNIEKYLFYSIIAMYLKHPVLPENYKEFVKLYYNYQSKLKTEEMEIKKFSDIDIKESLFEAFFNPSKYTRISIKKVNFFVSKNDSIYILYKSLNELDEKETKIKTYKFDENGNALHFNEMPVSIYQNFTIKKLKVMKKVFISYSKFDEDYKEELMDHFITLIDDGLIETFNCKKIDLGENSHEIIQKELEESDYMIALVSVKFLNTKYIRDFEVARAKELGKKIIPIIIKPCDWENSIIKEFHASLRGTNISLDKDLFLLDKIKETSEIERHANWTKIIKEFREKLFN
ncbi:MAG: leucine-rich repeat domain-containing protein [Flavobacteriales bacterium]|nr:leucine-rich repeat domain-containing protein [Flavobacteriales bacterium]